MRVLTIVTLLLSVVSSATADSISFGPVTFRYPTPAEIAGGVPADAKIRNFFVTTDGDILSIGNVRVDTDGSFYQHPAGSDAAPPNPLHVDVLPALAADSWIDTPGNTSVLGTPFPGDGSPNSAWGDLTNDGPQTNFRFARITISPSDAFYRFRFNVTIAGSTGPFSATPFLDELMEVLVPEPVTSSLAGMGILVLAAFRRRSNT
jgi:hypothetical protein